MNILISSLQVSKSGSKGHLHPALEIGLALQKRGHNIFIMPLPSRFSEADQKTVDDHGFTTIQPPPLPTNLLLSPEKLSTLAQLATQVHLAYQSFLVNPLSYQFDEVVALLQGSSIDIVIYDLLVYTAPLAARRLGIPDVGYCAGLKLVAPPQLNELYKKVATKLSQGLQQFLKQNKLRANFHYLELLSSTCQFVFTPPGYIALDPMPANTHFTGALLPTRKSKKTLSSVGISIKKKIIILSLGSVFDPLLAPLLDMSTSIKLLAQQFDCHLFISSKQTLSWDGDITILPYLPLSELLPKAALIIHHGGANTFSEACQTGTPQIIIPLSNDQPIQAYYLEKMQAGIAISPSEVNKLTLQAAFEKLLDPHHPIHQNIKATKKLFQHYNGAEMTADHIENLLRDKP